MNYTGVSEVARGEVLSLKGRRRLSVRAIAEGTGIPISTLNRRLAGTSPFTISEIDQLALFFGVAPQALLTNTAPGQVA